MGFAIFSFHSGCSRSGLVIAVRRRVENRLRKTGWNTNTSDTLCFRLTREGGKKEREASAHLDQTSSPGISWGKWWQVFSSISISSTWCWGRCLHHTYLVLSGLLAGILPTLGSTLGNISAVWEVEVPVTGYIHSSFGLFQFSECLQQPLWSSASSSDLSALLFLSILHILLGQFSFCWHFHNIYENSNIIK